MAKLTVEDIKREFPEFAHTSPDLIRSKLDSAYGLLSEAAWGSKYDLAVKYQVCHLIALSPSGEFARLKFPDRDGSTTTYERQLKALLRTIATPMVI